MADVQKIAHEARLREIEARVQWCRRWIERQTVEHPKITVEWRQLLEDAEYLLRSPLGEMEP